MSRVGLLAAAAFLALALVIVLYRPSRQSPASAFDRFAEGFVRKATESPAGQVPSPPLAQVPAAAIPHNVPPDPRALASDVARQATFDASASEGEFVTPPTVSIEH